MKIILTNAFLLLVVWASAMQSPLEQVNEAASLIISSPEIAANKAKQVISENSGFVKAKALAVLANVEDRANKPMAAYKHYSLAIEELYNSEKLDHYTETTIYRNMGKIAFNSNEYELAAEHYKNASLAATRYIGSENIDTLKRYGEVYLDRFLMFHSGNALYDAGLIEEAVEVYKSIDEGLEPNKEEIEDWTTFALLRNEYGLNDKAIGNYTNAKWNFKQVIESMPVHPYYKSSALHNMARTYYEEGVYDSALVMFDRAIALKQKYGKPLQQFYSYMDKGETLMKMNRNAEAVEAFESALATGASIDYDVKLLKIYLLAEDAATAAGIANTNYRATYMSKLDEYADHQRELIAAEKKRVFNMSLVEANHRKLLAEMESRQWWENFWNVVAYVLIFGSLAVGACTWYYRYRTAKMLSNRRRV